MRLSRFFALLLLAGGLAFAGEEPPTFYVDKGACPFECCTYGMWHVTKNTDLYESPGSAKKIGRIKKGEKVLAKTGEVHTRPWVLKVKKPFASYRAGERLYLLTYVGEGFFKVWSKGKVAQEEMDFGPQVLDKGKDAWGNSLEKSGVELEKKGQSTWWIQIKMKSGKSGWTQEAGNFNKADMDHCS